MAFCNFWESLSVHPIYDVRGFEACDIPPKDTKTLICWRHFKSDQFRGAVDVEKGIFGPLVKNAIPTEFLPGSPIIVSQNSPDFDLGGRVEIKNPLPKIPSKQIIHIKL